MALFDSIFGSEFYLTEDSIAGKKVEEDQDQNDNPDYESQANDNSEDTGGTQENQGGDDDNPDYESQLNDEDQEGDSGDNNDDQGGDDDNPDYESQLNDDEDTDQEEATGDGGDDDNPDYESQLNDDEDTDDNGDDQSSSEQDISSSDDPNSKLKELEKSIFDQLSPEQQEAKTKELKDLYIAVYDKCQKIITMVSGVDKLPSQAKIYDYIMNSLTDLQKYIRDYLDTLFDSKTYIENMTELQKYMVVLDTVNGVFEEMRKSVEDADK